MKPLKWVEDKRSANVMHTSHRGPMSIFVWFSENSQRWVWEIDLFGRIQDMHTADSPEAAKAAASECMHKIVRTLLGEFENDAS